MLSLLVDGMRSVRGFHLDRAAASVLTVCLSVINERYLFLGSRLGNSLLLQFTEKELGKECMQQSLFFYGNICHSGCFGLLQAPHTVGAPVLRQASGSVWANRQVTCKTSKLFNKGEFFFL